MFLNVALLGVGGQPGPAAPGFTGGQQPAAPGAGPPQSPGAHVPPRPVGPTDPGELHAASTYTYELGFMR